ncbi:MAG: radical SAM protein [Planctomycetota bacterium]
MLISWNTTRSCNLKCRHCYRDARGCPDPNELSTEEGKALIADVASAGFEVMVFSGGEPLLRADIYELIAHASRCALRPVVGSNGTLITGDVARRLLDAGAARVGVSLDSAAAPVHDALRGVEGCFDRALEGILRCRDVGLPFQIHTTITAQNYRRIEEIAHKAVELGASAYHVFFMVPVGRAEKMVDETLRVDQYERLLREIMKLQETLPIEIKPTCAPQFMRIAKEMNIPMRFTKGCLAGVAYACVLPSGDVHPCPYLPIHLGNVRTTPLSRIWKEHPVILRLRREKPQGRCGDCEFQPICGGCRARAYYYSGGDYMAEEPWCPYQPKKAAKLRPRAGR